MLTKNCKSQHETWQKSFNVMCIIMYDHYIMSWQRQWPSRLEHLPCMQKVGCSNPRCDRSKLLKQEVTAPLPNAQQQMHVSWVLRWAFLKRDAPCHRRCGLLKNPHCSNSWEGLKTTYKQIHSDSKKSYVNLIMLH